jgi:hypothetical protein
VHPKEGCTAEKMEIAQWGEWLRSSPRKGQKPPSLGRLSVSSSSYCGGNFSSDIRRNGVITVRDIPPRRNLTDDFECLSSSRTGGV